MNARQTHAAIVMAFSALLAGPATVVAGQLLRATLPGALDAWGFSCLGLFFGVFFALAVGRVMR